VSVQRIFVTGGGGFVGTSLLRALSTIEELTVTALDRSGAIGAAGPLGTIRCVRGDLVDPASYEQAVSGCDTVVHLAAATGKSSPEQQMRETALGTELLLQVCRREGVSRFLFVSSIAAAFPDKRGYPYAEAKERAELAVAASGLRFVIVRPTMILGDRAPILASLSALANLPFVLVPGSGRVSVQPVAVEDVVRAILTLLRSDRFEGETLEIGGPERLTMEALLQRIRLARKGRSGRAVRIPVGLIQAPLRLAERLGLRRILPATAAQLSSFRQEGTATANWLQQEIAVNGRSIASMLTAGESREAALVRRINHECRVFTRHLLGTEPDSAVVATYERALASVPELAAVERWDRAQLAIARRGVLLARCADSHAALFARSSALRKRLVMLLAILESRPPYAVDIDSALGGTMPRAVARVLARGIGSVLTLLAGTLILLPIQLALATRRRPGS
jgi:NADH dehydrogenase